MRQIVTKKERKFSETLINTFIYKKHSMEKETL